MRIEVYGVDPSTEGYVYAVGVSSLGAPILRAVPRPRARVHFFGWQPVRGEHPDGGGGGETPLPKLYVETPHRIYRPGAVAGAVLSTGEVAAACIAWSAATGAFSSVVGVTPEEWRLWLTGKRSPTDKQVKAALEAQVGPLDWGVNLRDALGVAL